MLAGPPPPQLYTLSLYVQNCTPCPCPPPFIVDAVAPKLTIFSGGVDRVDQVMGWRSCKSKSRRWTMTVLYYLLDTTRQ